MDTIFNVEESNLKLCKFFIGHTPQLSDYPAGQLRHIRILKVWQENVSELADALKQGDTQDIASWLADIAADETPSAYFLYFLPAPCPVLPPVPFSPQGGLLRTVLLPACPVLSCFPLREGKPEGGGYDR